MNVLLETFFGNSSKHKRSRRATRNIESRSRLVSQQASFSSRASVPPGSLATRLATRSSVMDPLRAAQSVISQHQSSRPHLLLNCIMKRHFRKRFYNWQYDKRFTNSVPCRCVCRKELHSSSHRDCETTFNGELSSKAERGCVTKMRQISLSSDLLVVSVSDARSEQKIRTGRQKHKHLASLHQKLSEHNWPLMVVIWRRQTRRPQSLEILNGVNQLRVARQWVLWEINFAMTHSARIKNLLLSINISASENASPEELELLKHCPSFENASKQAPQIRSFWQPWTVDSRFADKITISQFVSHIYFQFNGRTAQNSRAGSLNSCPVNIWTFHLWHNDGKECSSRISRTVFLDARGSSLSSGRLRRSCCPRIGTELDVRLWPLDLTCSAQCQSRVRPLCASRKGQNVLNHEWCGEKIKRRKHLAVSDAGKVACAVCPVCAGVKSQPSYWVCKPQRNRSEWHSASKPLMNPPVPFLTSRLLTQICSKVPGLLSLDLPRQTDNGCRFWQVKSTVVFAHSDPPLAIRAVLFSPGSKVAEFTPRAQTSTLSSVVFSIVCAWCTKLNRF